MCHHAVQDWEVLQNQRLFHCDVGRGKPAEDRVKLSQYVCVHLVCGCLHTATYHASDHAGLCVAGAGMLLPEDAASAGIQRRAPTRGFGAEGSDRASRVQQPQAG